MRVISGKHKRCDLKGFDIDGIRPTMDKVKESLFAIISPYLNNSICLDLFSGTGSLGIEALSNGAKKVYFVDNMKKSIEITKKNIEKVSEVDNSVIIFDNYLNALVNLNKNNIKFDIVFVDPPYGKIKISDVLTQLKKLNIINTNGIIVCEYENEDLNELYDDYLLIKDRKYGKTNIKIYKKMR